MIIRLFKGVLPSNLLLTIFIAIICWAPVFFVETTVAQEFTLQSLTDAFAWLNAKWEYSTIVVILVLIVVQAMYIIQVNHKHILIEKRSYLPALISTLLYLFFIKSPVIVALLLSNLLWLICIDILFSNSNYVIGIKAMFKIGLLIALGTLFHWFAVILIPLVWILSFVTNGLNIRGLLISLVGFITFWILFGYGLFLFGDIELFFSELLEKMKIIEVPLSVSMEYLPHLVASILTVMGFFATLFTLRSRKIIARKFFTTFFITIIYFIIIVIASIHASTDFLIFIIIPLTYTTSEYLLQSRSKWIPSIAFLTFIAGIALFWANEITGFLQ